MNIFINFLSPALMMGYCTIVPIPRPIINEMHDYTLVRDSVTDMKIIQDLAP